MALATRPARVLVGMIGALVMVIMSFTTQTTTAVADPDSVAAAQKRLDAIEAEASAIDAKYSQLQADLDRANAQLKQVDADMASQSTKVQAMSSAVSQLALSQYQSSGFDVTVQLLSNGSEDNFMTQLSTMQALTDRTNDQFHALQAEQAKLNVLKVTARSKRDAIAKATADQAELAKQYDAKEAEARQVLASLTSQDQARLKALQEKQAADRARAANAPAPTAQKPSPSAQPAAVTPTGSGRAAAAVAYAKAQVGKTYRLGATGPGSYDCSGLTLRSWSAAGVSLPRTSYSQFTVGVRVPVSQIQPGDLVFYYGGISHVAIYVGNGMVVHAANRRTGVRYAPLYSMPIAGVRRVG